MMRPLQAPRIAATSRARRALPSGAAIVAVVAASLLVSACAASWMPKIPPPWQWWSSAKKLGALPASTGSVNPQLAWQVQVGPAAPGFAPALTPDAIYTASSGGTLTRVDRASGSVVWQVSAGKPLSAGVGADATLVTVGTDQGDVLAFTPDGKPLWQAKVTSEILTPPSVAEGIVVVWSGDGRVFGLSSADGKTKWVFQRATPPLTVRSFAGGTVSRGGLFVGTAGGKLVALELSTGNVAWEANVATPKGATELERIADITSRPLVEERQACAVAYQGRVACFELLRGNLNWSRDLSSLSGLVSDARYVYVTDDKGAVHALDKATGASAWKQDKLAERKPSGPQLVGDYVLVVDGEGYAHLLDKNDGSLVGRLATDGTPATTQPSRSGANAIWQSVGGALRALRAG